MEYYSLIIWKKKKKKSIKYENILSLSHSKCNTAGANTVKDHHR